jgi:hypothetical protein
MTDDYITYRTALGPTGRRPPATPTGSTSSPSCARRSPDRWICAGRPQAVIVLEHYMHKPSMSPRRRRAGAATSRPILLRRDRTRSRRAAGLPLAVGDRSVRELSRHARRDARGGRAGGRLPSAVTYRTCSIVIGPEGRRRAAVRAASVSVGNDSASFSGPQAAEGNLRVSQTECPPGYATRITNIGKPPKPRLGGYLCLTSWDK